MLWAALDLVAHFPDLLSKFCYYLAHAFSLFVAVLNSALCVFKAELSVAYDMFLASDNTSVFRNPLALIHEFALQLWVRYDEVCLLSLEVGDFSIPSQKLDAKVVLRDHAIGQILLKLLDAGG